MFKYRYKDGLAQSESEMIKQLRLKGFAIVVMKAGALERGAVEEAMRKAAKTTMKARAT